MLEQMKQDMRQAVGEAIDDLGFVTDADLWRIVDEVLSDYRDILYEAGADYQDELEARYLLAEELAEEVGA